MTNKRWSLLAAAVAVAVIVGWWASRDDDTNPSSAAATTQPSTTEMPDTAEETTTSDGSVPTTIGSGPITTAPPPAEPPSTQPLSTTVQTAIPPQFMGPGGGAQSAAGLDVQTECDPETGVYALLSWLPATEPGTEQRVGITQFADGFSTGRFTASEPIGGDAGSLLWQRLEPGVQYRWQVFTLHGDIYTASETAMFRGADCFAGA